MTDPGHQAVTWQNVAPLLERWQIALVPQHTGTWYVLPNYPRALALPRHLGETSVPFDGLPQAIAATAARCAAAAPPSHGQPELFAAAPPPAGEGAA